METRLSHGREYSQRDGLPMIKDAIGFFVRSGLLEVEFERELHYARVAGRCDRTKRGTSLGDVWRAKRRRVRQIENFRAEVHAHPFSDAGALDKSDIRIPIGGTTDRIARTSAEREDRRRLKRARVEELRCASLRSGQRRLGHTIWPLRGESCERVKICGLRRGQWEP